MNLDKVRCYQWQCGHREFPFIFSTVNFKNIVNYEWSGAVKQFCVWNNIVFFELDQLVDKCQLIFVKKLFDWRTHTLRLWNLERQLEWQVLTPSSCSTKNCVVLSEVHAMACFYNQFTSLQSSVRLYCTRRLRLCIEFILCTGTQEDTCMGRFHRFSFDRVWNHTVSIQIYRYLSMYRVIWYEYQSVQETHGWTKLTVNLMWSVFVWRKKNCR